MKVFSLLSLKRNLENFNNTGIGNSFITGLVYRALRTVSIRCGVLFICVKVFQNLSSDKRKMLHTFFYVNGGSGASLAKTF